MFLNDLPGNDFNALFRSLPDMYKKLGEEDQTGNTLFGACFIAGVPGSFYGRLFPNKSMHFFHSSYSLMWLSKVVTVINLYRLTNKLITTTCSSIINV